MTASSTMKHDRNFISWGYFFKSSRLGRLRAPHE